MSPDFHSLRVKDIRKETADTVSISFELPEDLKSQFNYSSGQYITIKANIGGEEIRRSYSICSAPYENELRVAVKQVENGLFSTYAITDLKVGDNLEVMTPEGNFKINPIEGKSGNYVFFAAGSGITPVIAMVKDVLNTDTGSNVFLYYGSKTVENTIFKSELDTLTEKHMNFNLTYILSQEDTGNQITNGRINEGKCTAFYAQDQANLQLEGIYACGPQDMIETVKDFYTIQGLLNKVHFELFTVKAPEKTVADTGVIVQSTITIIVDDEECVIELATDGKSILQAAHDAGADVPFSCKGGVCCTCKAKVMEGSAKMDLNYALDDEEVEEGFILTCQAHPTSEKVVVSYDEY